MISNNPPVPIIYQDHHLLIVNKPAGLVIHPTYKHTRDTMWDMLLAYLEQQGGDDWQPPEMLDDLEWAGAPAAIQVMLRERRRQRLWKEEGLLPRPSLLHRIDKDTSGVVALARSERSRRHIIRQFHDHTIVKRYIAVVQKKAYDWSYPRVPLSVKKLTGGNKIVLSNSVVALLPGDEVLIEGPIQRDPDDRRRSIVGPDGQAAATVLRVLSLTEDGEFTFLEARPITGRTHQIRAHLAALGYTLVGDQNYAPPAGPGAPAAKLPRQFLHAHSLTLRRYPDNVLCTFVAPLAADLVFWLSSYFPNALEVMHADSLSA